MFRIAVVQAAPVFLDLDARLHANAVTIPGRAVIRLGEAAADCGVTVAIGVNERNSEGSDSTLYNTLLYLGPGRAVDLVDEARRQGKPLLRARRLPGFSQGRHSRCIRVQGRFHGGRRGLDKPRPQCHRRS